MQREIITARPDWQQQAKAVGFDHAFGDDGVPYWHETAYYQFTLEEIERDLEAPTRQLVTMAYQAVDHILGRDDLMRRLAIPEAAWRYIRASWRRGDTDLYGRFDLRYDGSGPPKLYEFNADTPTALFEAAVFQWQWREQNVVRGALPEHTNQFTSIHEKLIAAFGSLGLGARTLHLSAAREIDEDRITVEYLEDCAREAGVATQLVSIADIAVTADGRLTDPDHRTITDLFKLCPWELVLVEEFGTLLLHDAVRVIEPPWKMALASKGLLPVLWEMFPGHELLLPAYFDDDPRVADLGTSVARKPLRAREHAHIDHKRALGRLPPAVGPYGPEGFVVQALAELPGFSGNWPVIGSWVIAGQSAGIGIREEAAVISGDRARFVPHIILG